MARIVAVVTLLSFGSALTGCYTTYTVNRDEFAKLQAPPEGAERATVADTEGKPVEVSDSTALFVRSTGGRRYPVTPFNFKLTESQLVASDRDTLLALDGVAKYEVDHVSTWKTVGLVTLGVAAAAGIVLGIVLGAGQKTFN